MACDGMQQGELLDVIERANGDGTLESDPSDQSIDCLPRENGKLTKLSDHRGYRRIEPSKFTGE